MNETDSTETAPPAGTASRRGTLRLGAALAAGTLLAASARARGIDGDGEPTPYPDADILVLDKARFKARIGNAAVQRLFTGAMWAEGPAWNGVGRYLVFSNIPADEQLRFLDEEERVTRRFRSPSNNSNGNSFDREGRQISCEHLTRRVVRYEHDGSVTVLADRGDGQGFNAPNDVVVHPGDGSIWFTDPGFGALNDYEGDKAPTGSPQPYRKEAVWRIDAASGRVTMVGDELKKPNGLCFSPDYRQLYVADTGADLYPGTRNGVWRYEVDGAALRRPVLFAPAELDGRPGVIDGLRCDTDGNLWCGAGGESEGFDGVHVLAPGDGALIGRIRLPEICANVCFGGTKRNRLFMAASQSLYALYVNARGAHFC